MDDPAVPSARVLGGMALFFENGNSGSEPTPKTQGDAEPDDPASDDQEVGAAHFVFTGRLRYLKSLNIARYQTSRTTANHRPKKPIPLEAANSQWSFAPFAFPRRWNFTARAIVMAQVCAMH